MEHLYDSGLFSELGELMAHDINFYEDIPKQHFNTYDDLDQQKSDSVIKYCAADGEQDQLDVLLAEGNQLLDQFMAENGLDLFSIPVDLADIDELVSTNMQQHANNDLSDSSTIEAPSNEHNFGIDSPPPITNDSQYCGSSSPAKMVTFEHTNQLVEESEFEPEQLTDLIHSLLGDEHEAVKMSFHSPPVASPLLFDSDVASPCPSDNSDLSYDNIETDQSFDSTTSNDSLLTCNSPPSVRKIKRAKSTPYSKLPAGRKERKKQQNKEAAIRYREKKRNEALQSVSEESMLSEKNKSLKVEVLNIEREIMCMKELLSDVFNIHSIK